MTCVIGDEHYPCIMADGSQASVAVIGGKALAKEFAHPVESAGPVSSTPDRLSVFETVRASLVRAEMKAPEISQAIFALLNDDHFVKAFQHAATHVVKITPIAELLNPKIDEALYAKIGGYRDELQAVATAWGIVVAGVIENGAPSLKGKLDLALPSYLSDETMPIEVWEAVFARDAASLSYLALLVGAAEGAPLDLLGEYAELHCKQQRHWLDLLAWLYDLPIPPSLGLEKRQDWDQIFEDKAQADKGLEVLFQIGQQYPEGFVLGDLTSPKI